MLIAISAGHHPEKPGAVFGDFVEHAEAVLWRDMVRDLLRQHTGVTVLSVPVGVLRAKVEYINARNPVLAVEIHFNDAWTDRNQDSTIQDDEHEGRGSETLYAPGSQRGYVAAAAIQEALAPVFQPDRGVKEGWYRMDPRFGPDFFLARTRCPAVIIEPEFVRNAQTIRDHRSAGCRAIASGILSAIERMA